MKQQTFEDFLEERFIELREIGGIPIMKDNVEGMFDAWLSGMDGEDYMSWGDLYGKSQYITGKEAITEKITKGLKEKLK